MADIFFIIIYLISRVLLYIHMAFRDFMLGNVKTDFKTTSIDTDMVTTKNLTTINPPICSTYPTDDHHLINKAYADDIPRGISWLLAVNKFYDFSHYDPEEPFNIGYRLISMTSVIVEGIEFIKDNVYEWNGTDFKKTSIIEGCASYVIDDESPLFANQHILYTTDGEWATMVETQNPQFKKITLDGYHEMSIKNNALTIEDKGEDHTQTRLSIRAPSPSLKQLDITMSDITDIRFEPAPGSGINNLTIANGHREIAMTSATMSINAPLTVQAQADDTGNVLTIRGTDTNTALSVGAVNKVTTMSACTVTDYASIGTWCSSRGFHSSWLKITSDLSTFLNRSSSQKIYVDTPTHTLYMPLHTSIMEGYSWEITCSNNVTWCQIRVQKTGNNKALNINGEDVILYANQKVKITLLDSPADDFYGIWDVDILPTWGMYNQHFSYVGNETATITSPTLIIVYNDCKLTLPPGKWLITLDSAVYIATNGGSGHTAIARMTGETTFETILSTLNGFYTTLSGGQTFRSTHSCVETITTTQTYTFVAYRNSGTFTIPNEGNVRLRFNAYRLR
jgi:hypothetical protein